jgi:hypothetical protein
LYVKNNYRQHPLFVIRVPVHSFSAVSRIQKPVTTAPSLPLFPLLGQIKINKNKAKVAKECNGK